MASPENAWAFPIDRRPRRQERSVSATVVRVRLTKLFGLYSYDIPDPSQKLGRTPILYGENGLGKTNILKILFHVLSAASNRGHRNALAKIRFREVEVYLSNGVKVVAHRKEDKLLGAMRLEVCREIAGKSTLLGAWDWYPEDDPNREASHKWLANVDPEEMRKISEIKGSNKVRSRAIQSLLFNVIEKESNPLESEEAFLSALKANVPAMYFLTADRILMSDDVTKEGFRFSGTDAPARGMSAEAMVTKGRERALNEAIVMTSRALSQLGVNATRQGSKSMHSIYEDLIARLASRQNTDHPAAQESIAVLKDRLLELSTRYALFEKYGLAPQLRGRQLVTLLEGIQPYNWAAATEVLTPYVESLTKQAASLTGAYKVIDTLVSTVNEFLYDKSLTFSLGEGMVVRNKLGEVLDPSDLSSGEQQLLLLFCHIAMAHDSGGIFIIDEPEISLNIKWQRRLVDALIQLDPSENLQFLLASHSTTNRIERLRRGFSSNSGQRPRSVFENRPSVAGGGLHRSKLHGCLFLDARQP